MREPSCVLCDGDGEILVTTSIGEVILVDCYKCQRHCYVSTQDEDVDREERLPIECVKTGE